MPFNTETDAGIIYGKKYHEMLRVIAKHDRRNLRQSIEQLIEDGFKQRDLQLEEVNDKK